MPFALTSSAVASGRPIPIRYTCDGDNLSPPLAWTDPPPGTSAFALIVDDPDAPSGTFTHWLLCDVPATTSALDEGLRSGRIGVAGVNDFSKPGYGGPCPPRGHGPHRYRFHLHALGRRLGLKPGYSRADLDAAIAGAVLGTATLEATYERKR
jgi:Raf kinase inhibitor-like YbhB/YbcL family protein